MRSRSQHRQETLHLLEGARREIYTPVDESGFNAGTMAPSLALLFGVARGKGREESRIIEREITLSNDAGKISGFFRNKIGGFSSSPLPSIPAVTFLDDHGPRHLSPRLTWSPFVFYSLVTVVSYSR
jgi:hypothetical protein